MAPLRTVDLELDRPRKLRFDVNAIDDFERRAGVPPLEAMQAGRIGHIRDLLWAGLKWEDPKLTTIKTGDLLQRAMDEGTELEDIVDRILEALIQAGIAKRREGSTSTSDSRPAGGPEGNPTQ